MLLWHNDVARMCVFRCLLLLLGHAIASLSASRHAASLQVVRRAFDSMDTLAAVSIGAMAEQLSVFAVFLP